MDYCNNASVVIVCHHEFEMLELCLAAIRNSSTSSIHCIVVCNSGKQIPEILVDPNTRLIITKKEITVTEARNLGVHAVMSAIVVFVDPDVVVDYTTIEKMIGTIENNDFDGVIGSYHLPVKTSNIPTLFKTTMNYYFHQNGKDNTSFWTACGALRRDVFLNAGGFDTNITPPAVEDIELGLRLISKGKKIRFDKDIFSTHLKVWSWRTLVMSDIFDRAAPWMRLMLQNKKIESSLNLQYRYRFSLMLIFSFLFFLPFNVIVSLVLLLSAMLLNFRIISLFINEYGIKLLPLTILMLILYYICAGIGAMLGVFGYISKDVLASRQ